MIGRNLSRAAQVAAFDDTFLVGAIFVLLGVLPALMMTNRPQAHSEGMTILE